MCRLCTREWLLRRVEKDPERHEVEKARRRERRRNGGRRYWPSQLEWYWRNKEKGHAHKAVAKAVADGCLVRPCACQRCGKKGKVEGHHEDYLRLLEVEWLCSSCHRQHHGALTVGAV